MRKGQPVRRTGWARLAPARALRELGERIVAIRGVERGQVFLTAVEPHDHDHAGHGHDHGHAREGPTWHSEAHAKARPRKARRK